MYGQRDDFMTPDSLNKDGLQRLTGDYVVGTLSGPARRRFDQWLRRSPALRASVAEWEGRLQPLLHGIAEVTPPRRVWSAIQRRISPRGEPALWFSLPFWRGFAMLSCAVAIVLATMAAQPRYEIPPQAMMAMLMDEQQRRPAMSVAWDAGRHGEAVLRIRVIGHAEMSPETSWELWMLPDGNGEGPISLGKIGIEEKQTLRIPATLASKLSRATGMAMSVEPREGSPTGRPTGPILYSGHCIRM
jgi:anti-sigma-K factor RskA